MLLVLFLAQVAVAYVTQHDEAMTIRALNGFAWFYIAAAVVIAALNIRRLREALLFGIGRVAAVDADD